MPAFAPSSHEPVDNPKAAAQHVRTAYANNDVDYEMSDAVVAKKWQGTEADRKDMSELGKVQELRVREMDTFSHCRRLLTSTSETSTFSAYWALVSALKFLVILGLSNADIHRL